MVAKMIATCCDTFQTFSLTKSNLLPTKLNILPTKSKTFFRQNYKHSPNKIKHSPGKIKYSPDKIEIFFALLGQRRNKPLLRFSTLLVLTTWNFAMNPCASEEYRDSRISGFSLGAKKFGRALQERVVSL